MRRKKLPSRKRQALWRVLLALVSLLLVDHIFGIALLPIQAVRREAEHEGIGRAWVVERKWEPSLYKTHLFYLMENERAVMLGDTHLSPLGWETMFGATVDCTGEEPIYAGYHQISHDDKVLGCYFGQINDPAIETVVISIQQEEYDQGKAVRSELRRLTVEQEDFVTGRDRTFFWIMEPLPLEQSPEAVCYPVMIAYDAEGRIAAEFDIECCTYSGYGWGKKGNLRSGQAAHSLCGRKGGRNVSPHPLIPLDAIPCTKNFCPPRKIISTGIKDSTLAAITSPYSVEY